MSPSHGGFAPVAIRVGRGRIVAADDGTSVGRGGLLGLLEIDTEPEVAAVKQVGCVKPDDVLALDGAEGLLVNHLAGTVHQDAVHVVNLDLGVEHQIDIRQIDFDTLQ